MSERGVDWGCHTVLAQLQRRYGALLIAAVLSVMLSDVCVLQVGIALVASVLRARYNRIEPVERVSVQPKGRSYSRTLFARGT